MGGVIGNVDVLKKEILKQAKDQAETTLDRARRVSERDILYANDEAKSVRAEERGKIAPLLEVEQKKAMASAELETRKMLLEKRDQLVSRAFDDAQKRLEEMRGSQAYIDMLTRLIEESISNIKEDVIVQFGDKDKILFTSEFVSSIRTHVIKTLGKGIRVQFECVEDSIFSGVIVKTKDGRMVVDNSFFGLFKRLKEELRGKVSEMLLQED